MGMEVFLLLQQKEPENPAPIELAQPFPALDFLAKICTDMRLFLNIDKSQRTHTGVVNQETRRGPEIHG